MAGALALRLRALWLVCLLVLTSANPLGLLTTHAAEADQHAPVAVEHDAADHGIAPGSLPDGDADRHCLYCQFASSTRLGWVETQTRLADPAPVLVDWPDSHDAALRTRMRHGLPARAPPRV